MEAIGNAVANEYYEANIPSRYNMPRDGDPVRQWERFIRDKYEHKRFVSPGSSLGTAVRKVETETVVKSTEKKVREIKSSNISTTISIQKKEPAAEPSLLDFDNPVAPIAEAQQMPESVFSEFTSPPPVPTATNDFGDFSSSAFQSEGDAFAGFSDPTPQPQQAPPKPSSADILSLYDQPRHVPQNVMMGSYPGQYPPQGYELQSQGMSMYSAQGFQPQFGYPPGQFAPPIPNIPPPYAGQGYPQATGSPFGFPQQPPGSVPQYPGMSPPFPGQMSHPPAEFGPQGGYNMPGNMYGNSGYYTPQPEQPPSQPPAQPEPLAALDPFASFGKR